MGYDEAKKHDYARTFAITLFPMNDFHSIFLASLIALKPMSYLTRIAIATGAFGAAVNPDRVVARAIGLVGLIVTGAALLLVGISHGTAVYIALRFSFIVAAAYSWWHNPV